MKSVCVEDFHNAVSLYVVWFWHPNFLPFFCPLLIQTIATVSKVTEFFTERSLHPLPAATTAEAHSVDSLLARSLACHPYAAKEHMVMCWHSNYIYFHPPPPIFYFLSQLFLYVSTSMLSNMKRAYVASSCQKQLMLKLRSFRTD